ncbi:MAG: glycosyltransferase family 4 protein [Candidatus Cloacimonetes bacterium]|nr:glycosyltransferase family 4 protein [Candidatus Cloacimonadota bacterium]
MNKTTEKKIMITCPRSNAGGVYQFVSSIIPFLPENTQVLHRGSLKSDSPITKIVRSISSIVVAIQKMIKHHPNLILVNSSLSKECLIRDGLIIRLARFFNIRPILIIHGFQVSALQFRGLLKASYFKAEMVFVLAKSFADKLREAGYHGKVISQYNPVDHTLIRNMGNKELTPRCSTFLFLARVEESKGIFIALDIFKMYKQNNPGAVMLVAGTGGALEAAKVYAYKNGIEDLKFLGFVSGSEKEEAFRQSDVMLFPTSHNEGLPIGVLEAMAAGLIILTRPIAGLVDLRTKIDFGGMTSSLDPLEYLSMIRNLENEDKIKVMKIRNREFASANFHPQKIVDRILSEIDF